MVPVTGVLLGALLGITTSPDPGQTHWGGPTVLAEAGFP